MRASSISEALAGATRQFAGCQAVSGGADDGLSYGELHDRAASFASWLARHVSSGPVLYLPRSEAQAIPHMLGAITSGRMPLFGDPAWTAAEVRRILGACDARGLLWSGKLPAGDALGGLQPVSQAQGLTLYRVELPVGERQRTRRLPEAAFGRFTSGSTGLPRCLQFSERAALSAARGWQQATALGRADTVLCLAGLHNGLAFNTSLLSVLLSGGRLLFHGGRLLPASLGRTLASARPTVLTAFPKAYEMLAKRREVLAIAAEGLRLAVSSAAPLDADVAGVFDAAGRSICDYYGLAEVGPCTFNDGAEPGTMGRPLPGVDLYVATPTGARLPAGSVGRVRVRTPSMASGYLDDGLPRFEERVDAAGAYITQDRGLLTDSGRLRLLGRVGRLVNVAGRKVDPSEIEGALQNLDGVDAVVVRGEQSAGRVVLAAYIESRDARLRRDSVVAFCREQLAPYKIRSQS